MEIMRPDRRGEPSRRQWRPTVNEAKPRASPRSRATALDSGNRLESSAESGAHDIPSHSKTRPTANAPLVSAVHRAEPYGALPRKGGFGRVRNTILIFERVDTHWLARILSSKVHEHTT